MRENDEATRTRAPPVAEPDRPRFGRRLFDLLGPDGTVGTGRTLRLSVGLERLGDVVRGELDDGLALIGLVLLFAFGIVLYFALPREPWLPALAAAAATAIGVTALRRRAGHPARLAAAIAAVICGLACAAFETARVAAPRLDHERTVTVEGRVVDVDATARGGLRLTVDVVRMDGRGLRPETTPARITATLTLAGGHRPEAGDGLRFKARLKPPEGPVMPGGYDFARRAWFEGRGAGGYVLGRVHPVDLGGESATTRALSSLGALRHAVAERVRASLPGASGAIGAALMVGEQRAIPEEAAEPLRASGLTHIVSISGLHMGMVAGGVIVAVRALLALFPALVLGFPIKKWAAAAAFVAATIYLLLSGVQVAALRSHLMLSVALLAVLVDRPAITMHTVAVSAALILAVEPSSVMEPSFQMSYLAVIALVAGYDLYRARAAHRPPPPREPGIVGHLAGGILRQAEGFAVSSLIAGLATAPVIAGVFFRAAPYSILANMAVLPVTGLVIMPAAVVAALAMPFGLDHAPLVVMGLGIDWMVAVGRWASTLPGGGGVIGAPHAAMMPLGIVAVLWFSLWRSRIRFIGAVPALLALGLAFAGPRPDLMIGRHGAPIAVRGENGRLHVLGGRQQRFDTAIWLAADGDPRDPGDASLAEGWTCDRWGCVFALATAPGVPGTATTTMATGVPGAAADPPRLEIAVVRHPDAFAEECRRAALVVTDLVAPPGCRTHTTVLDRLDLARSGAATVDFTGPPRAIGRSGDGHAPPSSERPASRRSPPDPTDDGAASIGSSSLSPASPTDAPDGDEDDAVDPVAEEPEPSPSSSLGDPQIVPADPSETELPDPPTVTRDLRLTSSLPWFPRPWTPLDPRLEAVAREETDAGAP